MLPGSTADSVIIESNGYQTSPFSGITRIVGSAGDGNDTIRIDSAVTIAVELSGGLGDDELFAGGGAALLRGDEGDDLLMGGASDDQLFGGTGADTLLGEGGNDLLEGNDGDDMLDGGDGEDTLRGGQGIDMLVGGRDQDLLEGGDGDDFLQGDRGDDILRGGAGNDQLMGGRGDDLLEGGDGDDQINGDIGDDTIYGGAGNDRIDGGLGNDTIDGGLADVVIDGALDADTITGGAGDDTIDGGEGDDIIQGGAGNDVIFGGTGNDTIFADDTEAGGDVVATHTIDGGAGDDLIYGDRWNDVITGGLGNDLIFGLDGDDVISGDAGNDEIHGQGGNDLVFGGVMQFGRESVDLSDPTLFEKPPGFDEAELLQATGYVFPLLVMPKVVLGQSINGVAEDGDDILFGEAGTDWLFGGSNRDSLYGGDGADYLDAGAGNDANVFGGAGDDVVRGGANDDTVHGGAGVDQVYGDDGRDHLYGDQDTVGQKLHGGAGDDFLYAYAAGDASDATTPGDQLFGGAGADFLFGNLRDELLSGDAGNDFLSGDALAGPAYADNSSPAFNIDQSTLQPIGSDDLLLGGSGQDQLYGGGGSDVLWGGADSDWLEGQDDHDQLFGGGGIDILVADVNAAYQIYGDTVDGHGGNEPGDFTPDDNATDVLLIEGTSGDDTILLRAGPTGQLLVEYNSRNLEFDWLAPDGTPLVEQFRIAGLAGDDTVAFATGSDALDLSQLLTRGDFVATIDGGPGDDLLAGTVGRDRIDGGFGSDTIFGLAGDDRLWGDQGPGSGSSLDHDVLFAGQGNDDLIGGQGTNELYAWSFDPDADVVLPFNPLAGLASGATTQFGVFVDADGNLTSDDGDLNDDGLNDAGLTDDNGDVLGPYSLEDTGINRILGGDLNDELFGGTGLDFLYGAGGQDKLYDRRGILLENQDGGVGTDDGWKEYAQSVNKVWYISGSNANDQISIDFVTEPGILQGHHLVTRLTENNGSYSFAAQLRLDFAATDDEGNLIWKTSDELLDVDALMDADPFARAESLNKAFRDGDPNLLGGLLPPEDDFLAIIVDALGWRRSDRCRADRAEDGVGRRWRRE